MPISLQEFLDAQGGGDETSLTSQEREWLVECEQAIERGFQQIGAALKFIHDNRLYKEYGTWEDYCQERWQLSRPRSYQLMDAGEALTNLSTIVDIPLPTKESQVRPLVDLDPDAQRTVWQVVAETAPDGRVTAAHVRSVVSVFKEALQIGALPDGEGGQVAVRDLVKAAITEETYERLQRQRAHIRDKKPRRYLMRQTAAVVDWLDDNRTSLILLGTGDLKSGQRVMVSVWIEENETAPE